MKSVLVFIPDNFSTIDNNGYIYGKVVYDKKRDCKKFYIIGTRNSTVITSDIIGYYSNEEKDLCCLKKVNDWIQIFTKILPNNSKLDDNYFMNNIIIDCKKLPSTFEDSVIIIYNQISLLKAEFLDKNLRGSDFFELKEILEKSKNHDTMSKELCYNKFKENAFIYSILFFLYPVIFLSKITNKLLPVLKYTTLGMHVNGWLDNAKWMLSTLLQERRLTLKIRNHIIATLVDVSLGVLVLRLLLHCIGGTPPSQILLDNTEVIKISCTQF